MQLQLGLDVCIQSHIQLGHYVLLGARNLVQHSNCENPWAITQPKSQITLIVHICIST
jgi:hypothetical protein